MFQRTFANHKRWRLGSFSDFFFFLVSVIPHLKPTEQGRCETGNAWMCRGFCWCFCGLALRDSRCLPKQSCPVEPCVDYNEDTISTWLLDLPMPLLSSCLLSDVPLTQNTARLEACLNHLLQRHDMKVRASIKICVFHHGPLTQTAAAVILKCLIAHSFHKSAEKGHVCNKGFLVVQQMMGQ